MKKLSVLSLSWLGAVTAPHIFRKLTSTKSNWSGTIESLYTTGNDEIAYYIFPGILCPPDSLIKHFIDPKRYDLHLVKYGHKDYNPAIIANAVARHIKGFGYKKIRIISISMGDQVLLHLGEYLKEYVDNDRIEIVSIDSLPNPSFIHKKYRAAIQLSTPILMALRTLGGWVAEIPCFKYDHCWRSPAEVVEQLCSLVSHSHDYTRSPIMSCVKAVIKDGRVFYDPKYAAELFDHAFNRQTPLVHFNTRGKLANLRDVDTVLIYQKVFNSLNWKF